jgi:hypothetical protein
MARFSSSSSPTGIPQAFKSNADWNTWHAQDSWNGKHVYIYGNNSWWDAIFLPDDSSLNLPIGFTFTIVTDENTYILMQTIQV